MIYKENILRVLTLILVLGSFVLAGCQTTGKASFKSMAPANLTSFDGSRIAYDVKGEGDVAIVFIHCWTCNSSFWKPQVEFFANDYRVITIDLPGSGRSSVDRNEYSMESFGKDVAAVVDKFGAKKLILVGHSMGGPVSLEAAKLLGDKVIGIVGVDSFYTSFKHPKSADELNEFMQAFEDNFAGTAEAMLRSMFTPAADPELVDSIVVEMSSADKEGAISMIRAYFKWHDEDSEALLKEFAPILRNINAAPSGKEEPLDESVLLVTNVGHFIAQVAPDRFNEVLGGVVTGFISGKSCEK